METFLEEINKKIHGVPLQACYHCRKCTAGCPAASYMEYNPNKIIKMIQNGQKDKVLNSSTIWLCLSCETCITRCPNKVDIARMMDVLRQMAIESGVGAREKNILKFHEAFFGLHQESGANQRTDDAGELQAQIRGLLLRYGGGFGDVHERQNRSFVAENQRHEVRKGYFR